MALQGLLMVVLSIAYSSNHSSQSHKISEPNLVKYLEKLDSTTSKSSRERAFGLGDWNAIIDLFCKQHYLLKVRYTSHHRLLCLYACPGAKPSCRVAFAFFQILTPEVCARVTCRRKSTTRMANL